MAKAIPSISEISFDGLSISAPKILSNGGKMCYVSLANRKPFIFKTPTFSIPYGLSNWENAKFHIDVSLQDVAEITEFKNKIEELENLIIDDACNNSINWFSKKQSREVIFALFSSSIRYSKDANSKYPPTMKFKLPFAGNKFKSDAYNNKKEQIDINETTLSKGSKVTCIIQCSGIWIAGNKFGPSFNIVQVKVDSRVNNTVTGYAFIEDSDDESEI